MKFPILPGLLALLTCLASPAFASQPRGLSDLPDPSVEAERAAFVIPEGFEINLWAAEPLLRKPVQMNWDAQGRLWVVCSTTYPQIKPGDEAIDQVVVLEDTDHDGKADKSTIFAEDLIVPTALMPADGGCYVANSTEILFLKDTNGDGKADERHTVLSGFGTEDTHHLIHTFRFTPEGMLSFNQSIYIHSHVETPWGVRRLMGGGVWEFRPETRKLEVFCKGFINPWGREFDRWGQSFVTDGAGSEGINFIFPGAVFKTSPGAKRVIDGLNPGQPKQSGLEIIEEPHFPDDWQGTFVTCDFRGNRINRFQLTEAGSGYVSKQMPDVLASTHRGFRPIDVRTGPDGALYIADWFNPIIQHGEVDFRDPRRDRDHGRIWRITAKGRPLSENPAFGKMDISGLLEQLKSPRRWNRLFSKLELRNRVSEDAVSAISEQWNKLLGSAFRGSDLVPWQDLLELAFASETVNNGRWPNTRLGYFNSLASSTDHRVRASGLRMLSQHLSDESYMPMKMLEHAIADEHPQVRLWAIACLNILSKPEALPVALRALDKPMDNNLDFLLELMCREQADVWLPIFLKGKLKLDANPKHLVYALKATGKPEALQPLLDSLLGGKLDAADSKAVLAAAGSSMDAAQAQLLADMGAKIVAEPKRDPQDADEYFAALSQAAETRGVKPANAESLALAWLHEWQGPPHVWAAELAGLWKVERAREDLEMLAGRKNGGIIVAGLDGLARLGGPRSVAVITEIAERGESTFARCAAISALTTIAPQAAAKQAIAFLATTDSSNDAALVFEAFLKNKKLPVILAKELEGKTLPEPVAIQGIRLASSKGLASLIEESLRKAGNIRQMDKPLTPEEMTAMVAKVKQLGDAARGERVYRRQQLLCMTCHAIGGVGGVIGPDMVSLGAASPVDYLIESLLNPTAKIKEGYHMTMVTTKDGQVVAGGVAQDGPEELVIRDAGNNLHKVAKASIAKKEISPVSLMPPGLTASLREDEFLDLVRFLSELGREGPFKTQPNRYIRVWRTMGAMEQVDIDHVRHVGLFALNERAYKYPWEPKLSFVNGDIPLDELPVPVKMYPWFPRIAQCDLEMPAAGKVKLKLSATKGVLVAVNDTMVQEVTEELTLDLPAGKSVVSFVISRDAGELPAFRVEILDGPAKVVTGM